MEIHKEFIKINLQNVPQLDSCVHLLDEIGLNIELQSNSLINFARYVAMHDRSVLRLA